MRRLSLSFRYFNVTSTAKKSIRSRLSQKTDFHKILLHSNKLFWAGRDINLSILKSLQILEQHPIRGIYLAYGSKIGIQRVRYIVHKHIEKAVAPGADDKLVSSIERITITQQSNGLAHLSLPLLATPHLTPLLLRSIRWIVHRCSASSVPWLQMVTILVVAWIAVVLSLRRFDVRIIRILAAFIRFFTTIIHLVLIILIPNIIWHSLKTLKAFHNFEKLLEIYTYSFLSLIKSV